jgi:hypothetical protein
MTLLRKADRISIRLGRATYLERISNSSRWTWLQTGEGMHAQSAQGRPLTGKSMEPTRVHWALRIGVAMEFIGHGMAGLYRSEAWIPYYTFFGFSPQFAHNFLMYWTGTVDISLALLILCCPIRVVVLFMTFWGLMTSWLRPEVGESWFEMVERGANYGMPLALLWLYGWGSSLKDWFKRARPPAALSERLARQLAWIIRFSIALLLVGHGGLGIFANKKEWFDFFGYFGISQATVVSAHLSQWIGWGEIILGLAVFIKPCRSLLIFVLIWKIGTELLRPLVGQPMYQFIERGGDYVLPLVLLWLVGFLDPTNTGVRSSSAKSVDAGRGF